MNNRKHSHLTALLLWIVATAGAAAEKTVVVFVALADNEHQGIARVPAAIGNGDDPERNLYWGASEGLKGVFDRSAQWRLTERADHPSTSTIVRTRVYRHDAQNAVLTARAYRGAEIRQCLTDFESAVRAGSHDIVVFIGHNGLMDFDLPPPAAATPNARRPDCIVLCCKSEQYFKTRIEATGGRPILLTTQLMYPGAFILHAAMESWLAGENRAAIRASAGAAYATNQNISIKSGTGVFANLKD